MAAFRPKGRKYMYIEPTIGGRRLRRMSTGQKSKDLAEEMEAALSTLHRRGYKDLIVELDAGRLSLDDIWQAWIARDADAQLERLRLRKDDPLLREEAKRLRKKIKDERARTGVDQLLEHAPDDARFSWLLDFQNVNGFYAAMEAKGLRPNSVRRGPHRAVAELLRLKYGRGRMLAAMADVDTPSERDERRAMMWPDEIRKGYEKASPDFADVYGLAITTGIDRKPLIDLRVRDWNDAELLLDVPDEKAAGRRRTLQLEPGMAVFVRRLVAGKEPGDSLTGLTRHQIRNRWEALREALGRPELRLKDLRGVFITYAVMCAWPIRKRQDWVGHSDPTMNVRYERRLPVGLTPEPGPIAERMGLDRVHLRVEEEA